MADWTFFTNHGHVFVCIARDPAIRGRDLAAQVGITQRAALRIVGELVEAGHLDRERHGRRNHYAIRADKPLRHPVEQPRLIGEILHVLGPAGAGGAVPQAARATHGEQSARPT